MTQEAQLLAQKIKALRASAQSSRQRRAASLEAASRQRQELWRSCEGEEAARVLEELIQLVPWLSASKSSEAYENRGLRAAAAAKCCSEL